MESDHSETYVECAEGFKQSAELVPERRNGESEDSGDVEDVKYVNTQDYLDIGETIVSQCNRAAPEVATTLGFIKEELIDADDAELLAHTEIIRDLIKKKVEVTQETYTFIKTEEQIKAEPSIIVKVEDSPVDSVTASVIKEEPCTSLELAILQEQIASRQLIRHRVPTDTVLPSTTTSGVPVATSDDPNGNRYKPMEDLPRIEAPHDVTETKEVNNIAPKEVISKKLTTNLIEHNLPKKQKNPTQPKKSIYDAGLTTPDQEKYICDYCKMNFNTKGTLQQHMHIHSGKHSSLHDENKRFNCNLLTYRFSRTYSKSHLRTHTAEKPFKCDYCDYFSSQLGNLKTHKRIHTGGKPYKCDLCGYASSQSSHMKSHMRTHTGSKPFKCDSCNFASSKLGNLNQHMKTHTGEKPFKCGSCDYVCSHPSHLKRHMKIHTGEKPFRCDLCDYAGSRLDNFKKHMRTHTGEKPFKCDSCDYISSQLGDLKTHKRIHTGEKPYKCDLCGYASSKSSNLKSHMSTHTGSKPFKCDSCNFASSKLGNLNQHMRTHTGEKPFKCGSCDYVSSHPGHLKRHTWIHTGEKPFKCDTCDYVSSYSWHLKKHMKTHTGEKPFKCD